MKIIRAWNCRILKPIIRKSYGKPIIFNQQYLLRLKYNISKNLRKTYLTEGSACGESKGETNSSECCEHKLLSDPRISKELGLVKLSGKTSTDSEMCLVPKTVQN